MSTVALEQMKRITFGTMQEDGRPATFDLEILVKSRLLISANSGGGKSYLARKLLEVSHGKVQQIIIDLEGEFATLREKFDYLLVASKDYDVRLDVRTAELLARTIMENPGTSVIIDLSELKEQERKRYVRLFLEALVESPRELWHALIVMVDEAHHFDPEQEEAESTGAVNDLMTRGRKRGLCGWLATQRLSKLNKDAAAECNNVFIGRTVLDNDQKRASDTLGFRSKEQTLSLRDLEPGQFYNFGPAFAPGVNLVKGGLVSTTIPELGKGLASVPPQASAKIKSVLSRFAEVNPQRAESDLKDREATRKRILELERDLRSARSGTIDPEKLREIKEQAFADGQANGARTVQEVVRETEAKLRQMRDLAAWNLRVARKAVSLSQEMAGELKEVPDVENAQFFPKAQLRFVPAPRVQIPRPAVPPLPAPQVPLDGERKFGKCDRSVLDFLTAHADKAFTKVQVAFAAGYSVKSSGFDNALSNLRAGGLITGGEPMRVIDEAKAIEVLGYVPAAIEVSKEAWLDKLDLCPKKIYQVLLSDPERAFTNQELADGSGYSISSSGFDNGLSELRSLGLGRSEQRGTMRLNPELLEM